MKTTTRQLTIDGVIYLWRVSHRHRRHRPAPPGSTSTRICIDIFTANREGHPRAPLRVLFPAGAQGGPEYIRRQGLVQLHGPPPQLLLNRPGTAAILIRQALAAGWSPHLRKPLLLEDGFSFVANLPGSTILPAPVQGEVAAPGG